VIDCCPICSSPLRVSYDVMSLYCPRDGEYEFQIIDLAHGKPTLYYRNILAKMHSWFVINSQSFKWILDHNYRGTIDDLTFNSPQEFVAFSDALLDGIMFI
jgi:hypothetical protein